MVPRPLPLMGALALMSFAIGGCLPRGEPPAGRQIVADENASLLELVPPNGDGVLRVLFFRPNADPTLIDLWVVSVDPDGAPPSERMLLAGLDAGLQLSYKPADGSNGFPFDARGRVYVWGGTGLVRIDPVTGDQQQFTSGSPSLSPSGRRVLMRNGDGTSTLYEADDSTTVIPTAYGQFIGESVYYIDDDCALMRLAPGGVPEQLATEVYSYDAQMGSLILLEHVTPNPGDPPSASCDRTMVTYPLASTSSVLDTTTGQETPLPADLQYGYNPFSSDARWIVGSRMNSGGIGSGFYAPEWVLVDWANGTSETLGNSLGSPMWRPGHDELWGGTYDENLPGLTGASLIIKKPGEPPLTVPGILPLISFSEDGSDWFSQTARPDQQDSAYLVGNADDPTGPRYPVVPANSVPGLRILLPDGRLLVSSTTDVNAFRSDDFLIVDPRSGAMQVVGLQGFLSATGNTQVLGIYHYTFERGDLTTYDYATGHSTVLAAEFAMAAIAEAQGDDFYPPGARVVYQFRARDPSPWSGLWLATAP